MKQTAKRNPARPKLSIGIIFRDNIRSLERCLQALEPLRKAIPCQLVMADTGSADGSRAVAEKYADVLFDFPWVDDFSAARNAVIDRCTGTWHMLVDTDEYLDPDISQLLAFLGSKDARTTDYGMVIQRNYGTLEMDGYYSDAVAVRLLRPASGLRFIHPIHERLDFDSKPGSYGLRLLKTVFHHDGYAGLAGEQGKEKRRRNLTLLEEERRRRPEDLLVALQLIESSWSEPEQTEYLRSAVALVEKKADEWEKYGPAILRHAVRIAYESRLPELEAWIERAEEWFPDSPYTQIDAAPFAVEYYRAQGKHEQCLFWGERYLRGCEDYRAGKILPPDNGPLAQIYAPRERETRILLAEIYAVEADKPERAVQLIEQLDFTALEPQQIERVVAVLRNLQARGEQDLGTLLLSLYEAVLHPHPDEKQMQARRNAFFKAAFAAFSPEFIQAESKCGDFRRHGYTLFLPLAGQCGIGTAAAILETADPGTAERWLKTVESWNELPIAALEHALRLGISFPFADKPLRAEELDMLAHRMCEGPGTLVELTRRAAKEDFSGDVRQLVWTSIVALAAVQSCSWEDEKEGLALCRDFLLIQQEFLARYYSSEILREENIQFLPQIHRFIWHCERAFAALDAGDKIGYVHRLKEALLSCEGMKPMVEFLLNRTPQIQAPPPSPELLLLAEQVRTVLAAYDPEDPAVVTLKASPAYQKVSYLIEGDNT